MEAYRTAAERHHVTLERLRRDVRRVETARLVSFAVAAVVGLLYRDLPIGATPSLLIAAVATFTFLVLVVRHRRLRGPLRRLEIAEGLAGLGLLRIWRQWDEIAEEHRALGYVDPLLDDSHAGDDEHAYQEDLDLFGEASVRALLGPTPTPTGADTLRSWLRMPAAIPEIVRRQGAVRSLAPDFAGREALATEALLVEGVSPLAWSRFLEWLAEGPTFGHAVPRSSVLVARGLPPVTLTLFALDVAVGLAIPWWSWAFPVAVQGILAWRWGRALDGYLTRAGGRAPGLRRYHELFRAWERHPSDNESISELQGRLKGEGAFRASDEIRRLERWLDAADSRGSLGHFVVALTTLWDVHVAWGLERWRSSAGGHVEDWFEALGELEALAALATLAHDHPDWCWPDLREEPTGFEAEELGHPLLAESVLRTSDVRVEGPGRFLLVTGSNMSGKSTMLRSIGLAAVMGQAGSAVCARRVTMSPLKTFTSMRIQDSLTDGVSLFMAELNRLKALVDAAEAATIDGGPALLYLIDEVLQGTNSEERRIAARRIVSHLLDARAIGAVTTHDLSLHEDRRLDPAATKVHFRDYVRGGDGAAVLTFDYKLRPGLATSRNALKLLEIVGLGDS
jgi:hypothetical protein